jgi:protein ImuB
VRLRLVQPVGAQSQRLGSLLRERFARLELPQAVRSLRLVSGPLLDLPGAAAELFAHDRRGSGEQVPALVEQLRARLGHAAVHGLACVAEHRPEVAWRWAEPEAGALTPTLSRKAGEGVRALTPTHKVEEGVRPLWLLEAPEPCAIERFALEDGPERIESGWWDGHDVSRDYYVARDRHGARAWIFRDRRAPEATGWFVHGWFA